MIPKELVAARLLATRLRPYFSLALFALTPVESIGLDTLACDAKYRLYYDPKVLQEWSKEELAGTLIHEISHLLRKHHRRAREINAQEDEWNQAADAEINDDILGEGLELPSGVITPESLNQVPGKLAEVYYKALMAEKELDKQIASQLAKESNNSQQQSQQSSENQQTPQQPSQNDDDNQNSFATTAKISPDNVNKQGNSSSPQTASNSLTNSSDTNLSPSSSSSISSPSSTSSTAPGSSHNSSKEGDPNSASAKANSSNITNNPNASSNTPNKANKANKASVGSGRCGSCATGVAKDYEQNSTNFPGLTQVEAENLAKKVAKAILETSTSGRGNVAGGWKRWAEEKRQSKVDWRREMSSFIRASLATTTGAFDYTYSRPSRRQAALPNIVMPSMRKPLPSVAVVVDTSASMTKAMLSQALAEIQKILTSLGHQGLNVIACDRKVHWSKKIFKVSEVQALGGGGTDMRIGINEALKLKPTPQLIITITDGDSPWPTKEELKKSKLLIALTTHLWKTMVPNWAKVLLVS